MSTAAIRDTTIYYEQSGEGPDLIFIHGMCGDAQVWAGQVGLLGDRFWCTTYDRRGHSRSPRGDAPESDGTHADDAAALIEALELDPIVVASSGGARIAVELLRRRPDLVGGAVLSEPPLFSAAPEAGALLRSELAAGVPAAAETSPEAAVDAFFSFVCPGLWAGIDETARERYRANAPAMMAEFDAPPNHVSADDLEAIQVPVLVLNGSDTHPAFRAIADVLEERLPDVRRVVVDGSGHVTYAEQPEQFATAVTSFAADVLAADQA